MSRGAEVYETDKEWRFRVRAWNGEIVAQSEGYTTKRAAEQGLRALRRALFAGGGYNALTEKADAWDEGYSAGAAVYSSSDYKPHRANPYRQQPGQVTK